MANSFGVPIVVDTAMTQDAGLGRSIKVTALSIVTGTTVTPAPLIVDGHSNTLYASGALSANSEKRLEFPVPVTWGQWFVSTLPAGAKIYIWHR